MSIAATMTWEDANRHHLMACIARVRLTLMRLCPSDGEPADTEASDLPAIDERVSEAATAAPVPALEHLCTAFSLSSFERDILLMCAAAALDPTLARLCAAAHQDAQAAYPTFTLAIAMFGGGIGRPSRRRRRCASGSSSTSVAATRFLVSPLRIDERVLHHLLGVPYLDDRFGGIVCPVPRPTALAPSYRPAAERIAALWTGEGAELPVIQVSADARGDERPVVAAACAAIGLRLHVVRAADIPASAIERETFARLWERESILSRSALLIDSRMAPTHRRPCASAPSSSGWTRW